MFDLVGFLKGLLITNEADRSKSLKLQVSNSATTNTSTLLLATQTANRTLTLPDADGILSSSSATETLTNKTIDGDNNTLQDIAVTSLKALTASRAVVTDSSGIIVPASVTATELGQLSGVSSNIQTQISNHVNSSSNAHPASAIAVTPAGNLSSTNVQSALVELQSDVNVTANQTLSNLTSPTAVNQALIPGSGTLDLGSTSAPWRAAYANQITVPNYASLIRTNLPITNAPATALIGVSITDNLGLATPNNTVNDGNAAGNILIEAGAKTSGSGSSGSVTVRTGASTNSLPGSILLQTGAGISSSRGRIILQNGTEGTTGHVWTAVDNTGAGAWQPPKINYVISASSSGAYTTTSTSFSPVTNLSVMITTTGRPILLMLVPADSAINSGFVGSLAISASTSSFFSFARFDGINQLLNTFTVQASSQSIQIPGSSVQQLDFPTAGTYIYTLTARVSSGSTASVNNLRLVALEL